MKQLIALFRPKREQSLVSQLAHNQLTQPRTGRNPFEEYQVRSLVAEGMVIDGNVRSSKGAAVDGHVNGDVTVEGVNAALLIRPGATVIGEVRAAIVMISGEVQGCIEGRFVRLYAGSKITGTIKADRLIVDDGATIINESIGVMAAPALQQANVRAEPVAQPIRRRQKVRAEDFIAVMNVAEDEGQTPPARSAIIKQADARALRAVSG